MNIDPKDIRIGDRVRVTDSREIVAKEINAAEGVIVADDGSMAGMTGTPHWPRTFELIERPKPEAKLGSEHLQHLGRPLVPGCPECDHQLALLARPVAPRGLNLSLEADHIRVEVSDDGVSIGSDCGCAAMLTPDEIRKIYYALGDYLVGHPR